jgi:hypothetical protein
VGTSVSSRTVQQQSPNPISAPKYEAARTGAALPIQVRDAPERVVPQAMERATLSGVALGAGALGLLALFPLGATGNGVPSILDAARPGSRHEGFKSIIQECGQGYGRNSGAFQQALNEGWFDVGGDRSVTDHDEGILFGSHIVSL